MSASKEPTRELIKEKLVEISERIKKLQTNNIRSFNNIILRFETLLKLPTTVPLEDDSLIVEYKKSVDLLLNKLYNNIYFLIIGNKLNNKNLNRQIRVKQYEYILLHLQNLQTLILTTINSIEVKEVKDFIKSIGKDIEKIQNIVKEAKETSEYKPPVSLTAVKLEKEGPSVKRGILNRVRNFTQKRKENTAKVPQAISVAPPSFPQIPEVSEKKGVLPPKVPTPPNSSTLPSIAPLNVTATNIGLPPPMNLSSDLPPITQLNVTAANIGLPPPMNNNSGRPRNIQGSTNNTSVASVANTSVVPVTNTSVAPLTNTSVVPVTNTSVVPLKNTNVRESKLVEEVKEVPKEKKKGFFNKMKNAFTRKTKSNSNTSSKKEINTNTRNLKDSMYKSAKKAFNSFTSLDKIGQTVQEIKEIVSGSKKELRGGGRRRFTSRKPLRSRL